MHRPALLLLLLALMAAPLGCGKCADKPGAALASWNAGAARTAIEDFVSRVTKEGGPDYVPPEERIAVFDNDGTLWTEQPMYIQLAFALDRVKAMASEHPEWKTTQPFQAVLEDDMKTLAAGGHEGLFQLIGATHGGMDTEAFAQAAKSWFETAKHPKHGRLYVECVYQPMVELLAYLRENGFKTFIVSGGGIDFMRPITEAAYGIPPEQVVGSRMAVTYEVVDGVPTLKRGATLEFIDDKELKPVGIHTHIGRRPILAFGNSDGDFQMLEWTTAGKGPRLGLFVHHDDAERETAYDRGSPIGALERGLDEAEKRGWILVSMKDDWGQVFPPKP